METKEEITIKEVIKSHQDFLFVHYDAFWGIDVLVPFEELDQCDIRELYSYKEEIDIYI